MTSGPEKKLVRSKSGLRILPIKENERSPLELSEPEWIKDNEKSTCTSCLAKFDFVRRKHHCRRCGQIYCNACSKTKVPLPRMCFLDPVRMCSSCVNTTIKENDFYKNYMKILTTGSYVQWRDNLPDSKGVILHCSLSPDHCHLKFAGPITQAIPMVNISGFFNPENSDEKKALGKLSFTVSGYDTVTELQVPTDHSSTAPTFLWALQKAFQMTEEGKPVIGTGK